MENSTSTAIGFLGGTFDPIHFGHLRPAIEIQQALQLSSLYLMPNYIAPHKAASHASSTQRIEMVKLAINGIPQFSIDTRELLREKPSYTIDTLRILRAEYPKTPICFIMGMDSLLSFDSWHQYQDILSFCHLIISQRPGWSPVFNGTVAEIVAKHQTKDPANLHHSLAGYIYFQTTSQLEISSSSIRQCLNEQRSIDFLTPQTVCDYIKKTGCYS